MKKVFAAVLVCLMLCSCGSANTVKPTLLGTEFTAKMTYYNEQYSFDGKITEDGKLIARLSEPEELSDITLTLDGEQTIAEYKGITYTPIEGNMPFSAVMERFYLPIKDMAYKESVELDSDGAAKDTQGYKFYLAPTGLPNRLNIGDENFSITFYDISICEDVND